MSRIVLSRPRTLIALTAILGVSAAIVGAQAPAPRAIDQVTAQFVATMMEREHLSHPTIDDDISKKWFKNFITMLDPRKYYFLKEDIEKFRAQETSLDDQIKEGNIKFANEVFDVFLKRSKERLEVALDLLKVQPDFTIDENLVDDPEKLDAPADAKEANDRLRKWLKFELLTRKVAKADEAKTLKDIAIRHKDLDRYFRQFDETDLLEVYLSAMTSAVDPHSSFMTHKTWDDMLTQTLHLSLEGIGASLQSIDGYPVVMEVLPGMAADKDGRLQLDDKIIGIEKEDGSVEDFIGKKLSDVVRHIRGAAGSKVRLIVQPADSKEQKVYELTRQKVALTEQHAKGQVLEAKGPGNKPIKVGVIHLPAFYGDSAAIMEGQPDAVSATKDVRKLLDDFKNQKVDSVIVDVRHNGGGLLTEAITLSGLFINSGPVVQVRQARATQPLSDEDDGTAWDGPLVVLIDHNSASASEIFAGVIKDYGRGLIVGDSSTFGKGTVQSVIPLNEKLRIREKLGALKLTIQQFYRPNGESTQIKGVPSDVHIPSIRDQDEDNEGKLGSALKFDKIPALPHDQYNRVPSALVMKLQERSDERRKANAKFDKLDDQIKKFVKQKARHEVSLNEKKYRAEFVNADKEDDDAAKVAPEPGKATPKESRRRLNRGRTAWERDFDFVNNEILEIVSDYVTLGSEVLASAPVRYGQKSQAGIP
jgi:carboxyl-terminal processing protease